MDEMVFYTNPQSRGRMVRWMLEEVGQPYRTEIVDYARIKGPEYLAVNPMGKVPALRHGDVVVTEVAAICTYLADAFAAAGLAPPPGSLERASFYRWIFFAAGPIEAAITNKACGFVVPDGREGMMGYGTFETAMATLEGALAAHEHIAGGGFTAADLYVSSQLGFGMMFGLVDKRPAFADYVARMSARPAARRAAEIDDKLVADAAAAAG